MLQNPRSHGGYCLRPPEGTCCISRTCGQCILAAGTQPVVPVVDADEAWWSRKPKISGDRGRDRRSARRAGWESCDEDQVWQDLLEGVLTTRWLGVLGVKSAGQSRTLDERRIEAVGNGSASGSRPPKRHCRSCGMMFRAAGKAISTSSLDKGMAPGLPCCAGCNRRRTGSSYASAKGRSHVILLDAFFGPSMPMIGSVGVHPTPIAVGALPQGLLMGQMRGRPGDNVFSRV